MFLNFFFFFAYGQFGSHGLFAINWISRNNGPRCIGATLYYTIVQIQPDPTVKLVAFLTEDPGVTSSNHSLAT